MDRRIGGRGGGFTWIHLDPFGFTWIHLDSLGFTWTHLDSLELTWTHLDMGRHVHVGLRRAGQAYTTKQGLHLTPNCLSTKLSRHSPLAQGITARQSETGRTNCNRKRSAEVGRDAATRAAGPNHRGVYQDGPNVHLRLTP